MPEQAPAVDSPAVGRLIRFLVCGLPLGLFIMGALSFVIYFQKRNTAKELPTKPSQLSAMMRRDINADDLARYRRIFMQDIGPRTPEQAENMEIAVSFITSTMGFDNMGYQVVPKPFDAGGKTLVDLTVDLVSKQKADQFVTITASYAGDKNDSAASIAALMTLAHRFTGTKHARTLRFVAQALPTTPVEGFPTYGEVISQSFPPMAQTAAAFVLSNGTPMGESKSEGGPSGAASSRNWKLDAHVSPEAFVAELNRLAAEITKVLDVP